MRRALVVAVALGVVVAGWSVPVDAGQQNSTTVAKVVEGDGPDGPYEFEIDCDGNVDPFTLMAGESITGGGLAETCTVTETDDLGATEVVYSCTVQSGPATCSDDGQTVDFPIGSLSEVTITVTNRFIEPTTTTTAPTTTTAAPAPAAVAVAATPAFTG